jgi:ABC-type multidrug transport system fused ATPase/permease subunit
MAGRRALLALLAGVVGSVGLGFVELGIAAFLQLFLQRIGVLTQPMLLPAAFQIRPLSTAGLAGGLLGIALGRACGQYFVNRGGYVTQEAINSRLRRLAVYELLLQPSRRFVPAALINARMGETFPKAAWCGFFGVPLVASVAQGVVLSAVLIVVAWRESIVALGGLFVVGLLVLAINRETRAVAAKIPEEQRELTEGIERIARNIFLVRALRTEVKEHLRFLRSIGRYEGHSLRAQTFTGAASAVTPFFAIVLLLVIILASQSIFHTPGLALLSFLYLFMRFAQNLAAGVQTFSYVNQFIPQLSESISYVLSFSRADVVDALGTTGGGARDAVATWGHDLDRTDPAGPALHLIGLGYAYPGAGKTAIENISATIPPGSQFAVVGASGSGKSTLLALLLGIMPPDRGTIDIGGKAPADYFRDPAVRVGYVGAEPFLIAGSVRENLCYGLARPVDDEEIRLALDRAHLRVVVDQLPGGLAYPIAEDGSGLSAGQKQRLCLARALLNRPHVLVLDEVSANLDAATEGEIAESLRALRGRCTTILVSHRSAILKYADLVLELPSGSVTSAARASGAAAIDPGA